MQRTFFFVQVANGEELIGQVVHGADHIEYLAENVDQVVHGAKRLVHVAKHIVQVVNWVEDGGSACQDLREDQPCVADKCSKKSSLSKLIHSFYPIEYNIYISIS